MDILLKIMRAVVFPFRFVYLVGYAWFTNRRRLAFLDRLEAAREEDDTVRES
jgi:hypothetical protein